MVEARDIQFFYQRLGVEGEPPDQVLAYPSMMTVNEKALLYNLGSAYFSGAGAIIDAGLFLGASTNAFATGIENNPRVYPSILNRRTPPLQSYDIAIWNSGFDKYLSHPEVSAALDGETYSEGESFFPALQRLLKPHEGLIEFHIGDIVKKAHVDGEVEIAFYDCLKTYDRDLAVFNAFAPHYIPDRTIVVQQDYFYEDALDSKLRQELLSPYFEYMGSVASSAVFRLLEPIPSGYFRTDPVASLSVDESIELLDRVPARVAPSAYRLYAQLGTIRFMIRHDRLDEAERRLSELEAEIKVGKLPPRPAQIARSAREALMKRRQVLTS